MGSSKGLAQLHRTVIVLAIVALCLGCATQPSDPYAKNPNEVDPRVRVLDRRKGAVPDSQTILAQFKALKRPTIERYITYTATTREAMRGTARSYTHIVFTDEACAFMNNHTFDELVVALYPCTQDPYWSADTMALLSTAAWSPMTMGQILSRARYHSPDDQGDWPLYWKECAEHYSIGSMRGRWYIVGGKLKEATPAMLETDRRNIAALRRAGEWPKDEKTDQP